MIAAEFTHDFPEDYHEQCTLLDSEVTDGSVRLDLECAGTATSITLPGDALPAGLEQGETLDMAVVLPNEVDSTSSTNIEIHDDQGLVLVGFDRNYDRLKAEPLEFEFETDCAAVHSFEDSEVEEAAGFIRVSGDAQLDLAVGESGMVSAGGLDFEVFVYNATAYNCCHGNIIAGLAVRR